MIRYLLAAAMLMGFSGAAQAQSISAANPAGIAAAMKGAGFRADVDTDDVGDPRIITELNGWEVYILFYGCDEERHDRCDSLQLSTGFDRQTPMDPAKALDISKRWRFLATSLDDTGDPYLRWDIITDSGIPQAVFLHALRRYAEVLDSASEVIFADE